MSVRCEKEEGNMTQAVARWRRRSGGAQEGNENWSESEGRRGV